jgi:hypothetical protein
MSLNKYGSLGINSLNGPATGLNMYGGNDITPIVSNAASDGTLNVTSTTPGSQTNINPYLAIDRNSIQARVSNFLTSSKFENNLRLNPFGGKVGINSGSAVLSGNLEVYRTPGNTAGTAVFRGTTHASHFNFGLLEDTYIRPGKDGSTVYINDVPGGNTNIGGNITLSGNTTAAGNLTVNQDLKSASTGGLNLVPIGIFSFNLTYDNIVSNSGSLFNLIGNITTGWNASVSYGVDDDINFTINLNPALTSGYSAIIAVGDAGFRGPNYVSKATLENDNNNVYVSYTVDSILGRSISAKGKVMVYGIR